MSIAVTVSRTLQTGPNSYNVTEITGDVRLFRSPARAAHYFRDMLTSAKTAGYFIGSKAISSDASGYFGGYCENIGLTDEYGHAKGGHRFFDSHSGYITFYREVPMFASATGDDVDKITVCISKSPHIVCHICNQRKATNDLHCESSDCEYYARYCEICE